MALDYSSLKYLQAAGFKGEALRQAWAIMNRESGGRAAAYNGNTGTGDQSYGLFQINMLGNLGPARRKQYGLKSNNDLLDPATNARVAYQMSKGGTDFGAWAIGPNAYKGAPSNAYAKYKANYDQWDPRQMGQIPPGGSVQAPQRQLASGQPDNRAAILGLLGGVLSRTTKGKVSADIFKGAIQQAQQQKAAPQDMGHPDYSGDAVPGEVITSHGWKGSHVTDGLNWNEGQKTAGDIMAKAGTPVGAPEDGVVVRWGSAQGGQALYFRGVSGKMYWMGHIDGRVPVGTKVRKDGQIAVISADHKNPHLHIDQDL
jgi:murein DD-endopeptidase MepM/ murein hydrolase activator NlpD